MEARVSFNRPSQLTESRDGPHIFPFAGARCSETNEIHTREGKPMTESLEPLIRNHVFFSGLEDRHIEFITSCARNVRFEENQYIFHEGDPAERFYVIREGLISIELMVPQKGPTTLQTVRNGDVLGWSWLTPPYRWHFDARALRGTRALDFDGECLRQKCEKDHDLGFEVLKRFATVVSERLDATRLQSLDLYGVHA